MTLSQIYLARDPVKGMGQRREPRKEIRVPVRIFGTDQNEQIFSEKVFTVNVSRHGAELGEVKAEVKPDEIIGLTYGQTKGHFRVKWIGQAGAPNAGHIGLLNLSPEKVLWDFPLPSPAPDNVTAGRKAQDRRAHPRFKSGNSAEIYRGEDTAPIRARTGDISLGGCFVEMPAPLAKGTQVRIALWLKETKLWAKGRVVTSTPGYGIGVEFTEISDREKNFLREFIASLSRI